MDDQFEQAASLGGSAPTPEAIWARPADGAHGRAVVGADSGAAEPVVDAVAEPEAVSAAASPWIPYVADAYMVAGTHPADDFLNRAAAPGQSPGRVPGRSGGGAGRTGGSAGRAGGGGFVALVFVASLIAALLAAGGTVLVVTATRPAAAVAPAASPASGIAVTPATPATPGGSIPAVSVPAQDVAATVAAAARPSVVTITITVSDAQLGTITVGAGAGFVVSADGLILTAAHVVADSRNGLDVRLPNGLRVSGRVIATDATLDLALIRLSDNGLPALPLGTSANLAIGQIVVAIGSPLGTFTQSVTRGIVSGLGRSATVGGVLSRDGTTRRGGTQLSNLVQTDAAISDGNAGGPLLDSTGSVIGVVVTNDGAGHGLGFAVPIDAAAALIAQAAGSK